MIYCNILYSAYKHHDLHHMIYIDEKHVNVSPSIPFIKTGSPQDDKSWKPFSSTISQQHTLQYVS